MIIAAAATQKRTRTGAGGTGWFFWQSLIRSAYHGTFEFNNPLGQDCALPPCPHVIRRQLDASEIHRLDGALWYSCRTLGHGANMEPWLMTS